MPQRDLFDRTAPPKGESWLREAGAAWLQRFPESVVPWGKLGRWLKPLCVSMARNHGLKSNLADEGWTFVRPVWQRYVRERDERFVDAYEFATKFAYWLGSSAEGKRTLERIEATRAWEQVLKSGTRETSGYRIWYSYSEEGVRNACGERCARAFMAAGGAGALSNLTPEGEPFVRERFVKAWLSLA